VSADHPSKVIETFPGAAYSGKCQLCCDYELVIHLRLFLPSASVCAERTDCEGTPSRRKWLEGQTWSLLVSWQQGSFEMQDYQRVQVATGALLIISVINDMY